MISLRILVLFLCLFCCAYCIDPQLLDYFQKKVRRFSNYSCDLAWTPSQGLHLIAIADIEKDQPFLTVPSKYVFHSCKLVLLLTLNRA